MDLGPLPCSIWSNSSNNSWRRDMSFSCEWALVAQPDWVDGLGHCGQDSLAASDASTRQHRGLDRAKVPDLLAIPVAEHGVPMLRGDGCVGDRVLKLLAGDLELAALGHPHLYRKGPGPLAGDRSHLGPGSPPHSGAFHRITDTLLAIGYPHCSANSNVSLMSRTSTK